MNKASFPVACHRVKSAISPATMTHRVLALVLGIAPSEFRLMEARGEFPWEAFANLIERHPELDVDIAGFPEVTERPVPEAFSAPTSGQGGFNFPTYKEMAAFMDAEMARMGVVSRAAA